MSKTGSSRTWPTKWRGLTPFKKFHSESFSDHFQSALYLSLAGSGAAAGPWGKCSCITKQKNKKLFWFQTEHDWEISPKLCAMYFKNLRKHLLEKPSMCICFSSHDSSGNTEACPRGVSLRPMHLTVQDVKFWLLFGLLKPNCPQAFLSIKIYNMFLNRRNSIWLARFHLQFVQHRSCCSVITEIPFNITTAAVLAPALPWGFVFWGFFGLFWVCFCLFVGTFLLYLI